MIPNECIRRQGGKVVALPDVCPHRGAPLSLGQVR